jgi:hypothetical protein
LREGEVGSVTITSKDLNCPLVGLEAELRRAARVVLALRVVMLIAFVDSHLGGPTLDDGNKEVKDMLVLLRGFGTVGKGGGEKAEG